MHPAGIICFGLSGKAYHAPVAETNPNFQSVKIFTGQKEETNAANPMAEAVTLSEIIFDKPEETGPAVSGQYRGCFSKVQEAIWVKKKLKIAKRPRLIFD